MSSKLEINIRTLLAHCEDMVKANEETNDWRIKKYIKSLDTMIKELESIDGKTNATEVDLYHSRVSHLKQSTNYSETSPSDGRRKPIGRLAQRDIVDSLTAGADDLIREVNQVKGAKYQMDLRKDLLGLGANEHDQQALRKRINASGSGQSMGQAMKYYNEYQERIAEDMLVMTRNLKEQTETANRIIRRDTEVVSSSAKLTERNYSSLTSEADKLQDHSRRAWKCWMWLMFGLVMAIFIGMVMFMKVMKKRV